MFSEDCFFSMYREEVGFDAKNIGLIVKNVKPFLMNTGKPEPKTDSLNLLKDDRGTIGVPVCTAFMHHYLQRMKALQTFYRHKSRSLCRVGISFYGELSDIRDIKYVIGSGAGSEASQ